MTEEKADSKAAPPRRGATLALVFVCLFWGVSFVFIKDIDRVLTRDLPGPEWLASVWLVAVRFLDAGVVLLPFAIRSMTRAAAKDALLLAIPSLLGYALQVAGMRGLDPGTNAFLTSLYTPLTPILAWLLLRRVPGRHLVAAIVVALAGVGLLAKATLEAHPGAATSASPLHVGLVIAADVCWALQILGIDRWARKHPTAPFTCALFLWTGLGALLLFAAGAGVASADPSLGRFVAPLRDPLLLRSMAGLVLFSTLGAMTLMNRYQPSVDPSRAALLYTLEPVFAASFAAVVDGERFGGLKLVGCVVLLGANLVVEAPALVALARRRAEPRPSV